MGVGGGGRGWESGCGLVGVRGAGRVGSAKVGMRGEWREPVGRGEGEESRFRAGALD